MNVKTKNFIIEVTKEIGKLQLKNFSYRKMKFKTKSKYFNDIVTKVDKLSERLFLQKAKKFGFQGKILTEESGKMKLGNSNQKFILDPLDGSFFYSKGNPKFCVAIAMEENNKIVYATVHNPITKELWFAEKGKGSFLNGKKVKVSQTKDLNKSTITLTVFPNYKVKIMEKIFSKLMTSGGLRLLTHVANLNLCYIASGRYDGLLCFYRRLDEWDKIPGMFIAEQAGALVTDIKGKKYNKNTSEFIASNKFLHKKILSLCK